MTKEDLFYRYFSEINEFTHDDLANMTQIDYDREMAIVAVRQRNGLDEIIGVTRAISDADNTDAEFSVLVRSDLKGLGLGRRLLEKMIVYTRQHGLQQLNGITMPGNQGMISLARKLDSISISSWKTVSSGLRYLCGIIRRGGRSKSATIRAN